MKKKIVGVKTNFWNRIKCKNCGKKHFILFFKHYNEYEYGEQWFKKCKCGQAINIS